MCILGLVYEMQSYSLSLKQWLGASFGGVMVAGKGG